MRCAFLSTPAPRPAQAVLLKQKVRCNGDSHRVVAAAPDLSPNLTARAVIKGACLEVTLAAPLSQASTESKRCSSVRAGVSSCRAIPGVRYRESKCRDNADDGSGLVLSENEGESEAATEAAHVTPYGQGSSPLSAKVPVRGFHLVDLHAVVRNCVEWGHCLPKVGGVLQGVWGGGG